MFIGFYHQQCAGAKELPSLARAPLRVFNITHFASLVVSVAAVAVSPPSVFVQILHAT
jgi:hypothetical protein